MEAKANGTRNSPAFGENRGIGIYQTSSESDSPYYANIGVSELYGDSVALRRADLTAEQATRFFAKVQPGSGCWLWTGAKLPKGYGQFHIARVDGKAIHGYPHRIMFLLAHGEIPAGMEVCHHCDNPPCCNPDHLFLGTHGDNMRDSSRKGRKGGRWKKHVYPEHLLQEAMNVKRGGIIALARQHGVSFKALYMAVRRERLRRQRSLPGKAA